MRNPNVLAQGMVSENEQKKIQSFDVAWRLFVISITAWGTSSCSADLNPVHYSLQFQRGGMWLTYAGDCMADPNNPTMGYREFASDFFRWPFVKSNIAEVERGGPMPCNP